MYRVSEIRSVRQLRLFLDHNQLLRCGGRIRNAPLSDLAKFPYISPSRYHFTVLVIKDAHVTQLHSGELKVLFSSTDLAKALSHKGIKWKFIPKHAPWFGGFWEQLIGLSTLKKTLGRMHATLESLQTIIFEVEAILNDRPLTYASSDINDPQPITPAHLLYGRRIVPLPHSTVQMDEISDPDFGDTSELRRRAKAQAIVMKHFWSRWKHQYLMTLREAHRTTGDNMQ